MIYQGRKPRPFNRIAQFNVKKMMFQNLRANSQIYILHKEAKPYIEVASVSGVSMPKPKYPLATPPLGQMPQIEMVVDLSASINGQNTTFQGLPAGAEIAAMKQRSQEIVNSVSYHQGIIAGCDDMLNSLNPEFAEKVRQEQEIAALKEQMSSLMEMNRQLMQRLGGSEASSSSRTSTKE